MAEHLKKRNFWNSCPKKLDYFPEASCPLGKAGAETKGDHKKGCAWYINSFEDHYCFWTWLRRVSNDEGSFEPLLQHQMSKLMGVSGTKIHFILKEAMENLQKSKEFEDLKAIAQSSE